MGNANYSRKKFEVSCQGTRKASLIRHEPWQLSICEMVILNSLYLWTFCSVRCRATVFRASFDTFFFLYILHIHIFSSQNPTVYQSVFFKTGFHFKLHPKFPGTIFQQHWVLLDVYLSRSHRWQVHNKVGGLMMDRNLGSDWWLRAFLFCFLKTKEKIHSSSLHYFLYLPD